MSTGPSPQQVAATRRGLRELREAVLEDDVSKLRAALFTEHPDVVSLQTADQLRYGFVAPVSSLERTWSFGELCFHHNRPQMLRIAMEAVRPDMVDGLLTASNAAWLQHLCTRYVGTQFDIVSLVGMAAWAPEDPASQAMAELGVEFDPADAERAEDTASEEGRALIRAARMRVGIRRAEATSDAISAAAPKPSRPSRAV